MQITDEMIERAGRAMERARCPQWTDEQFEVWWNKDPHFVSKTDTWHFFQGTQKEQVLWEARIALEAAQEGSTNG